MRQNNFSNKFVSNKDLNRIELPSVHVIFLSELSGVGQQPYYFIIFMVSQIGSDQNFMKLAYMDDREYKKLVNE